MPAAVVEGGGGAPNSTCMVRWRSSRITQSSRVPPVSSSQSPSQATKRVASARSTIRLPWGKSASQMSSPVAQEMPTGSLVTTPRARPTCRTLRCQVGAGVGPVPPASASPRHCRAVTKSAAAYSSASASSNGGSSFSGRCAGISLGATVTVLAATLIDSEAMLTSSAWQPTSLMRPLGASLRSQASRRSPRESE